MRSPFALVDVPVIIMIDASVDGTDYNVRGKCTKWGRKRFPVDHVIPRRNIHIGIRFFVK